LEQHDRGRLRIRPTAADVSTPGVKKASVLRPMPEAGSTGGGTILETMKARGLE
jgi:hypothetical protein